jgi:hypothetical protein
MTAVHGRREGGFDRSFYVFLAVIGLLLVLTLIAFVVFGFPDVTIPGGPDSE